VILRHRGFFSAQLYRFKVAGPLVSTPMIIFGVMLKYSRVPSIIKGPVATMAVHFGAAALHTQATLRGILLYYDSPLFY